MNHEVLLHERTRNDGSAMRYDKSLVTKQHCKTPVTLTGITFPPNQKTILIAYVAFNARAIIHSIR